MTNLLNTINSTTALWIVLVCICIIAIIGFIVVITKKKTTSSTSESNETSNPKSNGGAIFFGILVIAIVVIGAVLIFNYSNQSQNNTSQNSSENSTTIGPNQSDTPSLFHRNATVNDIEIEISQEFSFSNNYTVTPKVDIADLELTFMFYDENSELLCTKVKQVGNVSEGITYTVSISLSEFSISQLWNMDRVRYTVSGGSVSYFA